MADEEQIEDAGSIEPEPRDTKGAALIRKEVKIVGVPGLPVGQWAVDGEVQPGRFSEEALLALDLDLKKAQVITVPFGQEFREAAIILGHDPEIHGDAK